MFVFNSSNHGHNPISFPNHSNFHFDPSPFDDTPLVLQQQQPQHDILLHQTSNFTNVSRTDYLIMSEQQQVQRKRSASSKRDRHSKINTLRGPRDRRMRLSLPVAREFFGLQDMLGVDKASKTVEWLLFQSRHAIMKLLRDHNGDKRSPSSVSDGEVVSGIDETVATVVGNKKEGRKAATKEKRGRVARKTALFHPRPRERREKARARARARTREKQLQTRQKLLLSEANPICQNEVELPEIVEEIEGRKQDLSKISSSWSTQMETGEESAGTQQIDQQLRTRDEGITIDDADDCFMMMGRWSPSSNSIYNSLHNNNGSPQEHPFGDFQFIGKPWEAYNNHGIC